MRTQGPFCANLNCIKERRLGDDTRCLSTALGWKRWLLVALLSVVADAPATCAVAEASAMSNIPGYEALLNAAQISVPADRVGALPWESNQFLADVFGDPVTLEPEFKRPRIVHDIVPAALSSESKSVHVENMKSHIKKSIPRVKPNTSHLTSNEPEAGRQQAINAWLELIKVYKGGLARVNGRPTDLRSLESKSRQD